MSRVVVTLLGRFGVKTDAGDLRFPTRKAESLLACLILHPEGIRRALLASLLWPDVGDDVARRNLRTTLWRVKGTINCTPCFQLEISTGEVKLGCFEVDVDAVQFKRLLAEARVTPEKQFNLLRLAESVYKGDLLEDRLDEWCEEERRELRSKYLVLLKELAAISKSAGETAAALRYVRRAVDLEPLDEDAQRELIVLLHLIGKSAEALAQFEVLRQLLKRELDVSPSQATSQVWQHIRSHRTVGFLGAGSAPTVSGTSAEEFGSRPMIGRGSLISDLLQAINDASHGRGGAALISGETGVGKTRLVEMISAEARLRGLEVLLGQCPDLQNQAPYQVFTQALWQRMSEALGSDQNAGPLAFLLRALVPNSQSDGRHITELPSDMYDSAIIVEAFLSLFDGRNGDRPTLLVLEDIHRIDNASANLLVALLGRLPKRKLFVLATMRSDELDANEIRSSLIAGGSKDIRLQPLSKEEIGNLIRLSLDSKRVAGSLTAYVWERSGGIPLFALEFAKYLHAEGMVLHTSDGRWMLSERIRTLEVSGGIPSRVQEIVRRRIESLDPEIKQILLTASVFSVEIHFEILRELIGISEDAFADGIDRLVRRHFLKETERGLQFNHDIVRLVATEMVGKARLRVAHGHVARLLERSKPWCLEDLAWHHELAGETEKTLVYAEASGDKARSVHANPDAAAWYSKALRVNDGFQLTSAQHLRVRTRLLQKRQDVLDLVGDRERQLSDIDELEASAQKLGDEYLMAESLCLRANLLIRRNMSPDALKSARLAGRRFKRTGNAAGVARSYEIAGLAYVNLRRYSDAFAEFARAQEMFRRADDRAGEARGLIHIGTCLGYSDRNVEALQCLDRAEDLLLKLGDRRNMAFVLLQKGILWRFLGQLGTSELLIGKSVAMFGELGDRVGKARGLGQLSCTHAAMGRLREAVHECETALQIARKSTDIRALIVILNNAAYGVYRLTGAFRRAERYVREALRLVSEAGNIEHSTLYEDTMAAVMLEAGRVREALRWAKRSFARYAPTGAENWLGREMHIRLGSILIELGQLRQALQSFQRAQLYLGENREPGSELLIAAETARTLVELGELRAASECERRVARLLRQVDGVPQIQKVYWAQFRVLRVTGRRDRARGALHRAAVSATLQASSLKGPMRRRFLAMSINSEIIREFWRSSRSWPTSRTVDPVELGELMVKSVASRCKDSPSSNDTRVSTIDSAIASVLAARRRFVLDLVKRRAITQRDLAKEFGVSVRTVRNDIASLRRQGLLEGRKTFSALRLQ